MESATWTRACQSLDGKHWPFAQRGKGKQSGKDTVVGDKGFKGLQLFADTARAGEGLSERRCRNSVTARLGSGRDVLDL